MSYPIDMKVVKLLITETGTYNEQYRRPYQSNLTSRGLNEILENASRSPRITPSVFSGISSQVLVPSAQYESVISIPEGWGERRFKFMLEIEVEYKVGGSIREIITGYSETPASTASLYGTLDPNTVFRVNNTIHVKTQTSRTAFGLQTMNQLADCSHVLSNNDWTGVRGSSQNFLLRPTDIFSRTITTEVEGQLAMEGSYDASTVLMNNATKSRRSNTIPTNYLSDIVSNYSNAYNQFGIGEDDIGQTNAFSTAQGYTRENSAPRDPFLETIATMNGTQIQNTFTLMDLERMDPTTSSKTIYMKKGPVELAQLHHTGQTQGWHGSDLHTHIANLISSSVPSIMMNHLIMKIAFISTNMDLTGKVDTRIVDINGFAQGVDMSQHGMAFISKFENEVFNDIVNNYNLSLGVKMQVDLIGESMISLTINGETIDYVVPSFSDALMTPIVTSDASLGTRLTSDLRNLMENIVDYNSAHSSGMGHSNFSGNKVEPNLDYVSYI